MRSLASWGVLVAVAACGGASPPPSAVALAERPSAAAAPSDTRPPPTATDGGATLSRSAIRDVVGRGLGAFLQRVEFEDRPVLVGGRFHGFRIAALHDPDFFRGVDLQAGDVVTAVNGFSIERPEQAQTVFDSLQIASELRIAYERDGQPREIRYVISDDR